MGNHMAVIGMLADGLAVLAQPLTDLHVFRRCYLHSSIEVLSREKPFVVALPSIA